MQSRETLLTMVKWTNAGGQTKRSANERSFVYRPPAWRRWRNVKTTYKGLTFLQSAFWIWITKRFSLVRECNVFLQCCILTLGPARQCLKRWLFIRLKCSLNRSYISYGELHCASVTINSSLVFFLKTVWVFWPERVVPPRGNSLWTVLLLPLCDQIACYVPTEKPMSIRPVNSQCSRQ